MRCPRTRKKCGLRCAISETDADVVVMAAAAAAAVDGGRGDGRLQAACTIVRQFLDQEIDERAHALAVLGAVGEPPVQVLLSQGGVAFSAAPGSMILRATFWRVLG